MPSIVLSVKQVADRLGVSIRTVYKHVKSGNLKAVKIGYLWRIREEDFEEFIRPKGG